MNCGARTLALHPKNLSTHLLGPTLLFHVLIRVVASMIKYRTVSSVLTFSTAPISVLIVVVLMGCSTSMMPSVSSDPVIQAPAKVVAADEASASIERESTPVEMSLTDAAATKDAATTNDVVTANRLAKVENVVTVEPVSSPSRVDLHSVRVAPTQPPSNDEPVTVAGALDRSRAKPGEKVTLVVRMDVDPAWHSYSATGPTGVSLPTKLTLRLPDGITAGGDWEYPEATMMKSIDGEIAAYVGELRFGIPLQIASSATASQATIECDVRFQACDHNSCLPPTTQTLAIPITIESGN